MPLPVILKSFKMRYNSLILMLLLFSCTQSKELTGFDTESWKSDVMGCNAKRLALIDALMERKAELTGLGQEEVVAILGKADMHELYSRNKKSFSYFLSNGPDCDEAAENPPKLVIRFDGLGRSKDIIYYKNQETK
jgi:hypothetical protein